MAGPASSSNDFEDLFTWQGTDPGPLYEDFTLYGAEQAPCSNAVGCSMALNAWPWNPGLMDQQNPAAPTSGNEDCSRVSDNESGLPVLPDQSVSATQALSTARSSKSDGSASTAGRGNPNPNRGQGARRKYHGKRPSKGEDEDVHIEASRKHCLVEQRYREGLKSRMDQLEDALSQTIIVQTPDESPDHSGVRGRRKKSDVLTDALNYVNTAEVDIRHLSAEVERLNEKVHVLEKLVKCEECPILQQMSMLQLEA